MLELTALARVSLARHRWLLLAMTASVTLGWIAAWVFSMPTLQRTGDPAALIVLALTLFPAGLATLLLFDYGLDSDLNLPESGCSSWLLRMPVRAWKVAIVPVVFKTIWISGIWLLFAFTLHRMGAEQLPWFLPCVVFSAGVVWIMVVSWRPFQSSLRRLFMLSIVVVLLYGELVAVFAGPTLQPIGLRTLVMTLTPILALLSYVVGVWFCVHATKLARISPGGIVPAHPSLRQNVASRWTFGSRSGEHPVRHHPSELRALWHHDYLKAREWIRWIYLLGVIPPIILAMFWIPLSGPSVTMALMWYVYLAGFATSKTPNSNHASGMLPAYLAASPLRTKTLAWSRALLPLGIAIITYCCALLVFAAWACSESNRMTWMRWAETQALSLGRLGDGFEVGLGISAATFLGTAVLFLGRIAAFQWASLSGRTWIQVTAAIAGPVTVLIPLLFALRWFLRQTDWEAVHASLRASLPTLTWVVAGLLLVKAVAALLVAIHSARHGEVSYRESIRVATGWCAVTFLLGIVFQALIPHPAASLGGCLALTALAIPLARILLMPLALSWNRHR